MNIDILIFIIFLGVNLGVGLFYSRGIRNLKEYAVGNRNFTTPTIAATIVATWIGGGFFSLTISKTYTDGLGYILLGLCDVGYFTILSYFLIPRMGEFLGSLSIAEAMGKLYGKHIRIITAISGLARVIGTVAIQFKVSSTILGYFFGNDGLYTTLLAAFIIIFYSSWGGIKAVTFTDIFQFFTFSIFVPILALVIWGTIDTPGAVANTLTQNSIFDFGFVFNSSREEFIPLILLAGVFLIPELDPAIFQRVIMAKNVRQARTSFMIAVCALLIITLITYWVAILLLASNPHLDPEKLVSYIIDNYPYIGLKGLLLAGVMALIMSTADSYLNVAAVLFSYDICGTLGFTWAKNNELLLSRISTVIIGVIGILVALWAKDLLDVIVIMSSVYMPIVTVPLVLAILGFRTTSRSILVGMLSGVATLIGFNSIEPVIDSTIALVAAILSSILGILGSHYYFGQPGGWVGIKDKKSLKELKWESKKKRNNIIQLCKQFNFFKFCLNNRPSSDLTYLLFGLFCTVSIFSAVYSIPVDVRNHYVELLYFIYHSALITASIFLTYPIWPSTFKNRGIIAVIWNVGLVYTLVIIGSILVVISNFGQFQLMIFVLNLVVLALLSRWQIALFMIFIGIFISMQFNKWYLGNFEGDIGTLQFKIMYCLLLFSSILIAFFKPKQEHQDLIEQKNNHLNRRINDQEKALDIAEGIKSEFIRNMIHELQAPTTGIVSMAQALCEQHDQLTDKTRKTAARIIYESATKLEKFDKNLATLSALTNNHYKLILSKTDISKMVEEQLKVCQRLYTEEQDDQKKREFITDIEENVVAEVDPYYIRQILDNLIINAITYCTQGKITISLKKGENDVEFSIQDEGIGVPEAELYDIFALFVVSSRTHTREGSRGIGLALCRRVIDLHQGKIWAENIYTEKNKSGRTIFKFTIPLEQFRIG